MHDSIVADVPNKYVEETVHLMQGVFKDLPSNLNRIFGINFDLELKVEIGVGKNMFELEEIK